MVGFKKKFRETPVFYFQNDQSCRQVLTLGKRSYPERIDHDTEKRAKRLKKLIFRMSLNVSLKRHSSLFFIIIFFISNTQTITIHYIYNSLQVTVIVYKKEIKRKRRTKSTKYYSLYINNYESLYFNPQRVERRERLATRWGVGRGAGWHFRLTRCLKTRRIGAYRHGHYIEVIWV